MRDEDTALSLSYGKLAGLLRAAGWTVTPPSAPCGHTGPSGRQWSPCVLPEFHAEDHEDARGDSWLNEADEKPAAVAPAAPVLHPPQADVIRSRGWAVAVHNDYRLNGAPHTFWLFTKGSACAKGEGRTDDEALAVVQCEIARLEKAPTPTPPEQGPAPLTRAKREERLIDMGWTWSTERLSGYRRGTIENRKSGVKYTVVKKTDEEAFDAAERLVLELEKPCLHCNDTGRLGFGEPGVGPCPYCAAPAEAERVLEEVHTLAFNLRDGEYAMHDIDELTKWVCRLNKPLLALLRLAREIAPVTPTIDHALRLLDESCGK